MTHNISFSRDFFLIIRKHLHGNLVSTLINQPVNQGLALVRGRCREGKSWPWPPREAGSKRLTLGSWPRSLLRSSPHSSLLTSVPEGRCQDPHFAEEETKAPESSVIRMLSHGLYTARQAPILLLLAPWGHISPSSLHLPGFLQGFLIQLET